MVHIFIVISTSILTGVHDLSSVSKDSSLGSLGLDSLTSAEVRQVLERQYNLYFTVKEIRALTMATLQAAEAALGEKS